MKHRIISIGVIILGTIFYNEFLVYEVQKLKWAMHECSECVKILLVADPQILGEKYENYFGSWLARWDSDRYNQQTSFNFIVINEQKLHR